VIELRRDQADELSLGEIAVYTGKDL